MFPFGYGWFLFEGILVLKYNLYSLILTFNPPQTPLHSSPVLLGITGWLSFCSIIGFKFFYKRIIGT